MQCGRCTAVSYIQVNVALYGGHYALTLLSAVSNILSKYMSVSAEDF